MTGHTGRPQGMTEPSDTNRSLTAMGAYCTETGLITMGNRMWTNKPLQIIGLWKENLSLQLPSI